MDIRTRNWQKARLTGFCLDTRVMTLGERKHYELAMAELKLIKDHWDSGTEKLISHPLKPYKCHYCGRRSNIEHLVDIGQGHTQNYCMKHFKEHQKID